MARKLSCLQPSHRATTTSPSYPFELRGNCKENERTHTKPDRTRTAGSHVASDERSHGERGRALQGGVGDRRRLERAREAARKGLLLRARAFFNVQVEGTICSQAGLALLETTAENWVGEYMDRKITFCLAEKGPCLDRSFSLRPLLATWLRPPPTIHITIDGLATRYRHR
jgi:hypothetical protein